MNKLITLLTICAAAAACAHTESAAPLPVAPERDWANGLEPTKLSDIAPVGPIENDQRAYDVIRRREAQHALGTKATALEIDGIIQSSSQVLSSALALPL